MIHMQSVIVTCGAPLTENSLHGRREGAEAAADGLGRGHEE